MNKEILVSYCLKLGFDITLENFWKNNDKIYRIKQKVEDETNLLNEGKRFRHLDLGIFLTPDPLEYVDGFNSYIYCNQNPWSKWDPEGLDTYELNRKLGGNVPRSDFNPISHTFLYTTNNDGTLKHTYSWGNDYDDKNRGLLFIDHPNDVQAAETAIKKNKETKESSSIIKTYYGEKKGDSSMDDVLHDLTIKNSQMKMMLLGMNGVCLIIVNQKLEDLLKRRKNNWKINLIKKNKKMIFLKKR